MELGRYFGFKIFGKWQGYHGLTSFNVFEKFNSKSIKLWSLPIEIFYLKQRVESSHHCSVQKNQLWSVDQSNVYLELTIDPVVGYSLMLFFFIFRRMEN